MKYKMQRIYCYFNSSREIYVYTFIYEILTFTVTLYWLKTIDISEQQIIIDHWLILRFSEFIGSL